MHTDTMIYEVRQDCVGPRVAVFHYYGETYTTLNFSLSTKNTKFKWEENNSDFLFYDSDLIILNLGFLVLFIGLVFEFKSN